MPRVRHIMPNNMREKINNLSVTDNVKTELIQLYRFDPELTDNVIQIILDTNAVISHIEISINNGKLDVNCITK